jgi:hypothetical protein
MDAIAFPAMQASLWLPRRLRGRQSIRAARICLAIMSGKVQGVVQGDETSTRSFEIPACAGFMLHERTTELLDLYDEDKEVACFGSVVTTA